MPDPVGSIFAMAPGGVQDQSREDDDSGGISITLLNINEYVRISLHKISSADIGIELTGIRTRSEPEGDSR